ncbi:hypothetical protein D1872_90090 [compost metagenome]
MNQPERQKKMKKVSKEDRAAAKEINTYVQRFNKAEQSVSDKQAKWKIIDMFDRGEQWKDVPLPPWVPTPIHNMIRYVRTVKRANLAGNIPAAHYAPLNIDQKDLIENIQRAYKHVWDTQRVPYTVRRCIDRALLQGTSIGFVYSDDTIIDGEYYGEKHPKNRMYQGEIKVKRIPITRFFIDPESTCLEDAQWIDLTEPTTVDAIKSNPKFREYAGKNLDQIKTGGGSDMNSLEVFDREAGPFQQNNVVSNENEKIILHAHWEYIYEENGSKRLQLTYYLKDYQFILYRIEDVKPSVFPFAVLYDEEEEDDFYGTATTWDTLEKQKIINKTEQTASIIGTLNQNPQRVVARESGINAKEMARSGTQPGRTWVTNIDPTRSVFDLKPPDIPKGLFELKDRAVADIKDIIGINDAYTGDSVGSLTTSTGVNSLIDRATIRDRDKMKQIDRFVEQLSDLIVLFIIEKWKEKRPIVNIDHRTGKITPSEWKPIKETDAKNLHWLVRSDVYASAPVTQAMKRQQADQLLQVQQQFQADPPIITLEEWLEVQDFENKHLILERMERDRKKKEEREAMDLANIIMQLADQARKMLSMGQTREQVMNLMTEQAKELLAGNDKKQMELGFAGPPSRPRDAAQAPQGPGGMTGQAAMMNMARGQ